MTRVIVYPLHEHERAAAMQALAVEVDTPAHIVGDVDDAGLAQLSSAGVTFEELEPLAPMRAVDWPSALPGAWDALDYFGRRPVPARHRGDRAVYPGYFLVRIVPPLLAPYHAALSATGATIVDRISDDGYSLRLTSAAQREAIRALVFVRDVRPYTASDTKTLIVGRRVATVPLDRSLFDVMLHRADDRPALVTWCQRQGIDVRHAAGRALRVRADTERIAALTARTEVALVQQHVPPKLLNDRARAIVGAGNSAPVTASGLIKPLAPLGLTGAGVIVGVTDSGLDASHPDFEGRVHKLVARGRPDDANDYDGHGTHVAATILGSGKASGGRFAGMAPGARLVLHSVVDTSGALTVQDELEDILSDSYALGARIHNASWGADSWGRYGVLSLAVDAFVSKHRDFLVVVAAGNAGTTLGAPEERSAPLGWVDWFSVGTPATSRNALVVGASRSDRTSGGRSQLKWSQGPWDGRFPVGSALGDQTISGDATRIAGFSSRGLTSDERVKPDLVAPGTDIASARAKDAKLTRYWSVVPGLNQRYAYLGGTSMAAPLVAGAAALVREYYVAQRQHAPSAALLKATLVNGTRWLTGDDAIADHPHCPNMHQGFGLLDLATTLPVGATRLAFDDDWQSQSRALAADGAYFAFTFTTTVTAPLRVTLAYTDAPMPRPQNNLDLIVERVTPPTSLTFGNARAPNKPRPFDAKNNVETVRDDAAPAGDWRVRVKANELTAPPQDFALVVLGALASSSLTLLP